MELQDILQEIERQLACFPLPHVLPPPLHLISYAYEEWLCSTRQYELDVLYALYGTFTELDLALSWINSVLDEADKVQVDNCRWIFDQCREGLERIRSLRSSKGNLLPS
ncbi:hypothetical protein EON65_01420 [archaeon]|nr:MAG: hypothetical protein EON65_01420 [archaeon]